MTVFPVAWSEVESESGSHRIGSEARRLRLVRRVRVFALAALRLPHLVQPPAWSHGGAVRSFRFARLSVPSFRFQAPRRTLNEPAGALPAIFARTAFLTNVDSHDESTAFHRP